MVVLWGTQALVLNVNGGVAFFSYLYLEETVGKNLIYQIRSKNY
jgi:hypothetical protein